MQETKSFLQKNLLLFVALGVCILFVVFLLTSKTSPSLSLSDASAASQSVYRFWSNQYKSHFYTISEFERDFVIRNDKNWIYEGVAFDAYARKQQGSNPVYRFWNSGTKSHFYTQSEVERDTVRADGKWRYEGVAYYTLAKTPGSKPVYRLYSPSKKAHYYVQIESEKDALIAQGDWDFEGIAFYSKKTYTDPVAPGNPDPPVVVSPTPTNGSCGNNHGKVYDAEPSAQLCASGSATSVSGNGPWTWSCRGSNGGYTSQCNAQKTAVADTQCNDGLDNDGDGVVDLADQDCSNASDDSESGSDQRPVTGTCGTSNGLTQSTIPSVNLCASGEANAVSGGGENTNYWKWTCQGQNGGENITCNANKTPEPVNGACGASSNQTVSTAPTTQLCVIGNASAVSGNGPWNWTCAGEFGGTTDSCSAEAPDTTTPQCGDGIDNDNDGFTDLADTDCDNANDLTESGSTQVPVGGVCGTADGVQVSAAPTGNLCLTGQASALSGNGPWNWNCLGTNGGADEVCSAPKAPDPVNAVCGFNNGEILSAIPVDGLCQIGAASAISGDGSNQNPWSWGCTGEHAGQNASCSATKILPVISGVCGAPDGQTLSSKPADNLCDSGQSTVVEGSGPWTWRCTGSNGGSEASCSADKTPDPVNATCGSSHSKTLDSRPTSGLCGEGNANSVTGDGPWNWICSGLNGGTDISCSADIAPEPVDAVCGFNHEQSLETKPNEGLCQVGNASSVAGSGPWNWTCAGLQGGVEISCNAQKTLPPLNGACGTSHGQVLDEAPAAELCLNGTASAVSGSGPWNWNCVGDNGGSTAQCAAQKFEVPVTECNDGLDNDGDTFIDEDDNDCANANDDKESGSDQRPVNGQCSGLHGQVITQDPQVSDLCDVGAPSATNNTDGDYTWSCEGINDGTTDQCQATFETPATPINGTCNPDLESEYETMPPADQLCATGTLEVSETTDPDYFNWYCRGIDGGSTASCKVLDSSITPLCSDGIDNDNDGDIDFPDDLGCSSATDMIESDGPFTNGVCGSANNVTVVSAPTANLCNKGPASDVSGSGPWSWTCGDGRNGGSVANCVAALDTYSFKCGPADGKNYPYSSSWTRPSEACYANGTPQWETASGSLAPKWTCENAAGTQSPQCSATADGPPTPKQCADGIDNDNDGVIDLADTDCTNASDDTESGTSPTNGQCGSANGTTATSVPGSSSLCSNGAVQNQNTAGSNYTWNCQGQNGGTNASCSLTLNIVTPVNGQCGTSNGGTYQSAPSTNLCNAGGASSVSGSGPWNWTCNGTGGGTNSSCSASKVIVVPVVNGQCGSSDGQTVDNAPTTNLCTAGSPTSVSGSGPWNWSCTGASGGTTSACTAQKTPAPVAGCGIDHGKTLTAPPQNPLCTGGLSSADETGNGPWLWTCRDGGTLVATCRAEKQGAQAETQGKCGASRNTCDVGNFIDTDDSSTQHLWGCIGSGGFSTFADCSLDK